MPRSEAQGKGDSERPFRSYRQWAERIAPRVQAALAGKQEVPPQPPFTEAWLTYALYWRESPMSLEEVIFRADSVNHAVPNPEEIAWAFIRLRKRGWLSVQGDSYALTAEGRRAVESIVDNGDLWEQIERLEQWTLAHPMPGDE